MWGKGKFFLGRVFMTLEPDRLTLKRLYSIGKELSVLWIIGKEQMGWWREGPGIWCYLGVGMEVARRQSKMYFKQMGQQFQEYL